MVEKLLSNECCLGSRTHHMHIETSPAVLGWCSDFPLESLSILAHIVTLNFLDSESDFNFFSTPQFSIFERGSPCQAQWNYGNVNFKFFSDQGNVRNLI